MTTGIWRILSCIVLLFSILFMPFWMTCILAILGMIYFRFFVEAVALLFLSDLFYGVKEVRFLNSIFITLITSSLILVLVEFIKKKLKFYSK